MRSTPRRLLFSLLFLLAAAWTVFTRPAPGAPVAADMSAPQVGFTAPAFSFQALDGQRENLADLRGRAVVLNFWASWCPPCRAEMPAVQTVYVHYRDRGLVVLAVDAGAQDSPANMQTFLDGFAHSYIILRDESGALNRLYAVGALPTTYFIGRDGKVHDLVIGGPLSEAGLSARVEALLQEVP